MPLSPRRFVALTAAALCVACSPAPAAAPPTTPPRAPGSTAASGTTTATAATAPTTPGDAGTADAPTATPPSTPPADPDLTLAFGGDVHFAHQLAPRLKHPTSALAELRPYLATADVAMVNLETAITGRGTPAPKSFHFRAPATALDALDAAGVDVVTMANNHAVDYGGRGFTDTLAARRTSPVPVVGIGTNERDALRPAVLTVRGRRLAVLAATQVPEWTAATWPARRNRPGVAVALRPARLVAAVRAARRSADVVVVYLHWGTDYTGCPNALQRSTARALADAGADVVVGTHAHRVQGAGWLGRTYVGYGLGNFVWWRRNDELQSRSGVLTLTMRGRRVVGERWTPMRIQGDGMPRVPAASERQRLSRAWQRSRACTGLSASPH